MNDQYINELIQTLEQTKVYIRNDIEMNYDTGMQTLVTCFTRHKEAGTQIFFIGNGGSSAIASHMTADFMKNGGMKTYSLYDNAVTTCMGNDYGYEYVNNIKYTEGMGDKIAVYGYEACKNINHKFVITTTKYADEIEKQLQSDHRDYYTDIKEWAVAQGIDMTEWDRDYCAWYHSGSMEKYFAEAECDTNMNIFWDKDSVFYIMFNQLDLDNVIELAVGRGRHVTMYEMIAKHIILVDILQENIDFCKERFKGNPKIEFYCNNGYNLSELRDGEYSALFTYDAMVHFEMMDIFEYLKDIHRVLRKGGMALFHHSNNCSNYKNSFFDAEGRRSYMSKDLFAYLAYRVGFEIAEQKVIDWGVKDLDCITLVRKV